MLNKIEKITHVTLFGMNEDGKSIKIDFPNVLNAEVEMGFNNDASLDMRLNVGKDINNSIFTISLNNEEKEKMNGSIIYCRFGRLDCSFDLNSKIYAYYIDVAPDNLNIGIGSIFILSDNQHNNMYKNALLRCEGFIGVSNKTDAFFLEGRELKEFNINNIDIIKHSILYKSEKCLYNRYDNNYTYNNKIYSKEDFWNNIVAYNNETINRYSVISEKSQFYNRSNKGVNNMENKNIFGATFKNMPFGRINTDTIKYSFNGIAFQTDNGDYVVYNSDFTFTNVNNMVIDIPIFAMPVSKKDIKNGDVIQHDGNWVIVNSVSNNEIKVARPWNKEIVSIIPETSVFGFSFYTKIINPFDNLNKTADENNPFGDIFPFLLLSNDSNSTNDMFMLMMMNKNINLSNPLLFYAMMDNKNDLNPLLLLTLSGNNPFINESNKKEDNSLYSFYPTYVTVSTDNIEEDRE